MEPAPSRRLGGGPSFQPEVAPPLRIVFLGGVQRLVAVGVHQPQKPQARVGLLLILGNADATIGILRGIAPEGAAVIVGEMVNDGVVEVAADDVLMAIGAAAPLGRVKRRLDLSGSAYGVGELPPARHALVFAFQGLFLVLPEKQSIGHCGSTCLGSPVSGKHAGAR